MASEVKLPELGENLTEGDVLDIKVSPGDIVSAGQTLIEVEAEKSTIEVPSPLGGRVAKVLVRKGQLIHVGETLCVIDETGLAEPQTPQTKQAASAPENAKTIETQPATGDEPVQRIAEETAPVTGNGRRLPKVAPDGKVPAPTNAGPDKPVPAGPATRRLARDLGIDLRQVPGSAPGGRVTQDDVKAYVQRLAATGGVSAGVTGVQPVLPDFAQWGPVERQPLGQVRRKTAGQMALAWSLVPHVTQHDQADITELEAFRKQQEGQGPKLTVTAFVLKAAAIALQQFPDFNSSLDLTAGQLIRKQYYHLGVAVDTDRGLLVPVLRDVDKKSVHQLADELTAAAERARQRKLHPEELRGGTFTITNLGGIGGTGFTPIVNYPEVAILGLSRGRLQPVVQDGQVTPRLILPLSLSYDHRVIDGANVARFTRRIVEMIENPLVMLLHA
jgi:pyruvate dehydrogenase E2 component (dihydrolipoamide acetyltransferase)